MSNAYWPDWYSGWGWFLWFGIMILIFSSIGNWGYTYRVHRTYGVAPRKGALDILDLRYAQGEITREQHSEMKAAISAD